MGTKKIISPYFEDGKFAGVRVCVGDEDFAIAPKDYSNGKGLTWYEVMNALKVNDLDTWNYRQICLTMAYRKEVDKVLKENGGDDLDNWYWTRAENSDRSSFSYFGFNGALEITSNHNLCDVRLIKNLKNA